MVHLAKRRKKRGITAELCFEKRGSWLKVIGANNFYFSAVFEYEEDGKRMFMYITHGSDTPIELD